MSKMTAEDEEAVALEMEQLEKEAQGTLNGTAPKVGIQVRIMLICCWEKDPDFFTAYPGDQPSFCSYYRASGPAGTRSDKGRGGGREASCVGVRRYENVANVCSCFITKPASVLYLARSC